MQRILVPSIGPLSWKRLLGKPDRHWVRGKSAMELAASWEAAGRSPRGLPDEVARCLDSHPVTRDAELLIGLPEHQVKLPGGGGASQSDLWALLGTPSGTVSLAVEAKAGETFDLPIAKWLQDQRPGSGKPARLQALRKIVGIETESLDDIRYQLLHRSASALLRAIQFRASAAVLMVQAFGAGNDADSELDFTRFCSLLGAEPVIGSLCASIRATPIPLLLGWVTSEPASDAVLADLWTNEEARRSGRVSDR